MCIGVNYHEYKPHQTLRNLVFVTSTSTFVVREGGSNGAVSRPPAAHLPVPKGERRTEVISYYTRGFTALVSSRFLNDIIQ